MERIPIYEKKFFKRTISGYSKDKIIQCMIESIFEDHKKMALYCCIELLCSGFYEEIFYELFIIIAKYSHTNMPMLPKYFLHAYEYYLAAKNALGKEIIEFRNDIKFRQYIEILVILLCDSKKQFILLKQFQKYFIPLETFPNEVDNVLKKFKKNLWRLTKLESFNKTKSIEENAMTYLGFILNHSSHEQLWNILLEFAKYVPQKHIIEQVGYLYQIYLMVPFAEKTFLPLFATLFFFRGTFIKIKQFIEPSLIKHSYYENIRNSVLFHSRRPDYINFQKPLKGQLYKITFPKKEPILPPRPMQYKPLITPDEEPKIQMVENVEKVESPIIETNQEVHVCQISEDSSDEEVEEVEETKQAVRMEDDCIVIRITNRQPKEVVNVSCINNEDDETIGW